MARVRRVYPPSQLGQRVQALVRRGHRGNVKRAAKEMGLEQRTLAAIIQGQTKNPSADSVQKIAAYFGVPMEWLLTGEGQSPIEEDPFGQRAEVIQWYDLVLSLKLPEPANRILGRLPDIIADATNALKIPVTNRRQERPIPGHAIAKWSEPPAKMLEAYMLQHLSWTRWLEDWIEAEGREKVRRAIIRHAPKFQARFLSDASASQ